jgi:hypothetical protein
MALATTLPLLSSNTATKPPALVPLPFTVLSAKPFKSLNTLPLTTLPTTVSALQAAAVGHMAAVLSKGLLDVGVTVLLTVLPPAGASTAAVMV